MFILGDDFRIRRIQRFLDRQWIHVTAGLRVLGSIVSVFSAMLGSLWSTLCAGHGVASSTSPSRCRG